MVNTNAQNWLNEKYPIEGICQRNSDQENKNKKREEITKLDISKGKVGKDGLFSEEKNLTGSLKLVGFTNLQILIISAHQLTELDASGCPNLEELDCQNNQLTSLNVNNCLNLKKIDCSNNNLKELDLFTCAKLEEVNINNCSDLITNEAKTVKSNLIYDTELGKLVKGGLKITQAKEGDTRNILIIGITGNGKSALANTLAGTYASNEFAEKDTTTSVTKIFQKSEFAWEKDGKKIKYRIIDNIGFGDTNNITEEAILQEIGKGIHSAKEGINQILFVFKGRFSPEHVIAFNIFKRFIAESHITDFTTIIRTNFESFKNSKKVAKDKNSLLAQNEELRKLIESCKDIIYVDNPSLPVVEADDSDGEKESKGNRKLESEKTRAKSRKILLDYLADNCQEIYKLSGWDNIVSKVNAYNEKKEKLEKSNSSTKETELKKMETELAKEVDKTIKGSVGVSIPGLPVALNAAIEYVTHKKY